MRNPFRSPLRLRALVATLLLAPALLAEDTAPPAPEKRTEGKPAKAEPPAPAAALTKFLAKGDLLARVDISEVAAAGGGAMGGAMIVGGGGGGNPPFEGPVEAWRPRGGALVVATANELDGFAAYFHDDVPYVTRTGVAGEAPGLTHMTDDLPRLLDLDSAARWAPSAKWKVKSRTPDGSTIHTATLKARTLGLTVGGGGGMGAMMSMRGKILRVEVDVETDMNGQLVRFSYAVVRNHPMSNLAAMGGGVQIQGMPGGMQMPKPEDEAKRTVFKIAPKTGRPSARTLKAHARFKELLANEDDE